VATGASNRIVSARADGSLEAEAETGVFVRRKGEITARSQIIAVLSSDEVRRYRLLRDQLGSQWRCSKGREELMSRAFDSSQSSTVVLIHPITAALTSARPQP
jgi:hypothetical protein